MANSDSTLIYEVRNRVGYVTFNRPNQMNAMNRETFIRLSEAIVQMRDDPDVLLGIVTGAGGKSFSSGMDLKERAEFNAKGETLDDWSPPHGWYWEIDMWKPLIAAIDGYCIAGGLELALKCDIRIATQNSQFGMPEPRWSLTGIYGLQHLERMVPLGEALYMQLTGSRITAQEAHRIGLIHSVHNDRISLLNEAEVIAADIKLCAPLAVQAIKKVVMMGRNQSAEYTAKLSENINRQLQETEDSKEGPQAFSEKRLPIWKMR